MKKTWQSPQLIVLVRGKPQEAVLQVCKFATGATPHIDFAGCGYTITAGGCKGCDVGEPS